MLTKKMKTKNKKTLVIPKNVILVDKDVKRQMSHYCLRSLLIFGRCLNIFPVEGLMNHNPEKHKFKFVSIKMFLTILMCVGTIICCLLASIKSFSAAMVMHRLSK